MSFCHICEEEFNAHNRAPRVTPCGHSACLSCILEVINQGVELECQECNVRYRVDSLDDFPPNIDLMELLDQLRRKEERMNGGKRGILVRNWVDDESLGEKEDEFDRGLGERSQGQGMEVETASADQNR